MLRAAFSHPDFKAALEHYSSTTVASPHLFTRLTVPNLCVGPLRIDQLLALETLRKPQNFPLAGLIDTRSRVYDYADALGHLNPSRLAQVLLGI